MEADRLQSFAGRLLEIFTGSALTPLISLGYRTGLYEAATRGPATSAELAQRAGLQERYVREWLGAMVTAGFFTFDPASGRYTFPAEHAALLTGPSARNLAPTGGIIGSVVAVLPDIERCFRDGGGVPYAAYRPAFTDGMDDLWRRIYDEQLVPDFLGAVSGLTQRLTEGVSVLDIGCGTGHAVNVMAREYPRSVFVGYDISAEAIERAEAERATMGLGNASFTVLDAAELPTDRLFDVVTAFDAIHDQRAPDEVLRRVHDVLAPAGEFVMVDFKFSSKLEHNVGNPFAPLCYAISLMHCMPVSLAEDGAGLGAVWGEEMAREMLATAGFTSVDVLDSPRPQNCIYVCCR